MREFLPTSAFLITEYLVGFIYRTGISGSIGSWTCIVLSWYIDSRDASKRETTLAPSIPSEGFEKGVESCLLRMQSVKWMISLARVLLGETGSSRVPLAFSWNTDWPLQSR